MLRGTADVGDPDDNAFNDRFGWNEAYRTLGDAAS